MRLVEFDPETLITSLRIKHLYNVCRRKNWLVLGAGSSRMTNCN